MKRRFLSLVLVLSIVASLITALPLSVSAATVNAPTSGKCGDNLTWEITGSTLRISGTGPMYDYNAWSDSPWYLTYQNEDIKYLILEEGITTIGSYAFYCFYYLKTITIPEGVERINNNAFASCAREDTRLTLSDSVKYIGDRAFINCWLYGDLDLSNVTYIGDYAFNTNPQINNIIFSEELQHIGKGAFGECNSLTTVTIPASVEYIGGGAFSNCTKLTEITVDKDNENYISEDSVLYTINKDTIITYPSAKKDTSYTLPDTVTEIASSAFSRTNLENIQLPEGLKCIGNSAFYNSRLKEIVISDNVEIIDDQAFYICGSLSKVKLPQKLKEIGDLAFERCALEKIEFPDGTQKIGKGAFSGCDELSEVTMSSSPNLEYVGTNVFEGTTWYNESSNWEDGVLYLGDCLLEAKETITECDIRDDTTVIASYAFYSSDVEKIVLPKSVKHINLAAFAYCCELEEIDIHDNILSLGEYAFEGCENLKKVTFGSGLSEIKEMTFLRCRSLTEANIPDNIKKIDRIAFNMCDSLKKVVLGSGVEEIGEYAFCASPIESFSVSENNETFYSQDDIVFTKDGKELVLCANGKEGEYTIPGSVEKIRKSAFAYCDGLTKIDISNNVKTLPVEAFYDCDNLKTLVIPNSVSTIEDYATTSCSSLKNVYYKGTRSEWNKIDISENNHDIITSGNVFFNYKPNSVMIEFFANGGEGAPEMMFVPQNEMITLSDVIPTMRKHSFVGWATSENAAIAEYIAGDTASFAKDTSLYAVWELSQYEVFYNPNGGEINAESGCADFGSALTLTNTIPTRTKHRFTGWATTSDAASAEYQPGESVVFTEDTTLYAVWELSQYEVFYNVNGGSFDITSEYFDLGTEAILTTAIPTRDEYKFIGWATTSDASSAEYPAGATISFSQDTTLYAVWEPTFGYTISNGEATITSCPSSFGEKIVIPAEIDGYPVTAIGDSAFYNNRNITEVVLPDTVKRIESRAFYYCSYLRKVKLGRNVEYIGDEAFYRCEYLEEINIPLSVTDIMSRAFYGVSSAQVYYSGTEEQWSMINIDSYSRRYLERNIIFGYIDGAVSLDYDYQCTYQKDEKQNNILPGTEIAITDTIPYKKYCEFQGWSTSKDATEAEYRYGDSITVTEDTILYAVWKEGTHVKLGTIEYVIFDDYAVVADFDDSKVEVVEVLSSVNGYPVKKVGYKAFYDTSAYLKKVILPDSVEEIEREAFYASEISEIVLGEGIKIIRDRAFYYTSYLESISIGKNIQKIEKNAFYNNSKLTNVYYSGTSSEWNKIDIDESNTSLLNTNITNTSIKMKNVYATYDSGKIYADIDFSYIFDNGSIILALYDENDALISSAIRDLSKTDIGKYIAFDYDEEKKVSYVKAFVWDGISSIKPLTNSTTTIPTYGVIVNKVLETAHPYKCNTDESRTYTYNGECKSIDITFNELTDTYTDYIYIYDKNNSLVGSYKDEALAGKTVRVPGNVVRISFKTDDEWVAYGYKTERIIVNK